MTDVGRNIRAIAREEARYRKLVALVGLVGIAAIVAGGIGGDAAVGVAGIVAALSFTPRGAFRAVVDALARTKGGA